MADKELLDLLNKAVAREIQVSIQYLWQHILVKGIKGFAIKDELKNIAISEMKHAEEIAERISYLGGTPTTNSEPINVGKTLKEMIQNDKKDEEIAIELYNKIIKKAKELNDHTTMKMFMDILEEEEEHHDFFTSLLEGEL